jgi:hypothetical protein
MAWNFDLLRTLTGQGIDYVVIGGVAAILHGSVRLTDDVDICAELTHENAVRIIRAFAHLNPRWRMRPDLPVIAEDSGNLVGLKNMYLLTDLGQIDILGELPGVCAYEEARRTAVQVQARGLTLNVLDIDRLIAAKRFANRPKDRPAVDELELMREIMRRQGDASS